MADVIAKRGYTYAEAAAYLGLSTDTIKRLVSGDEIPVRYVKSKPILDRLDLDAFLESRPSEKP